MRHALSNTRNPSHALLALTAAVACLAYWAGLDGPFIFDDYPNLRPIQLWLDGKLGLTTLLFERGGGTLGRPVSMASFALNAKLLGYNPFSFKLVNLALHLLTGVIVFLLVRRLLQLDSTLRTKSAWLGTAAAALWLLHPLHASTVLYSVQRMAQLSALIILLGLGYYLTIRLRIESRPGWQSTAGLFLGIPAVTAIAFLAKENGALLPLLCCVVELSYFSWADRPRSIKAFLLVFGATPLVAAGVLLVAQPQRLFGAYVGRDFDAFQRMLSQGRALSDYVVQLLLPNPSRMGVFTDDFPISSGWFDPPTTALSFAALSVASIAAWRMRRLSPTVTFGWFFFLVAHSLEASFLPLDLYYEHRNYLPSVGLLTAVVALFALLFDRLAQSGVRIDRVAKVALAGPLLMFAAVLHGRALVWQNSVSIATSGLLSHPQSISANAYVLGHVMALQDSQAANRIIASLMASDRPRNRALAHLYRVYVGCGLHGKANAEDLEAFARMTPMPVTIPESQPFYQLYENGARGGCEGIPDHKVGAALRLLANRAEGAGQAATSIRYQAAAFFARGEEWGLAEEQGKLAWQPGSPGIYAIPLIQAYIATGRFAIARQTLQQAKRRVNQSTAVEADSIARLERHLEHATRGLSPPQSGGGLTGKD
jgi:protein O-mannosyl-transferase